MSIPQVPRDYVDPLDHSDVAKSQVWHELTDSRLG